MAYANKRLGRHVRISISPPGNAITLRISGTHITGDYPPGKRRRCKLIEQATIPYRQRPLDRPGGLPRSPFVMGRDHQPQGKRRSLMGGNNDLVQKVPSTAVTWRMEGKESFIDLNFTNRSWTPSHTTPGS